MRRHWLGRAAIVGGLYAIIAVVSARIAGAAGTAPPRTAINVASFAACGVVILLHATREIRLFGQTPRATALHAGAGGAIGGFLLAVILLVQAVAGSAPNVDRYALALLLFPLTMGIPAFVAALIFATLLARRS